ncbi:MAG TPA: hypothetical protein DD666_00800 [Advenella kashmirensis]|uniref:Phage gp6-like head-tail connector protein n=1 Tax=Advenella kashmirensis TaxID=310575 RepID=A0A356LB08_9BURK|nr:hypothetical protein [Advenella kashmirensis]
MINLALAKRQCYVDHDLDDALIEQYIKSTYKAMSNYLNRVIIEAEANRTGITDVVADDAIDIAGLLIVAHLYQNRETATDVKIQEIVMGHEYFLRPYRIEMGV